jgi:hypothetical protein
MNSVCIIIPYFGKWPPYMPIYLLGCKNNPSIDFLFFSDAGAIDNAPINVRIVPSTLKDFNTLVSNTFELNSQVDATYKICDIRPAFFHLFKEHVAGYKFWGWGDIDLVYGDLSILANKENLEKYDVISGRKYWVSGSFCLLRNNQVVNDLFLSNDDYREVFSNPKHTSYSECGKKWGDLIAGKSIFDIEFTQSNFTLQVREAEREGKIKVLFQDVLMESIPNGDYVHYQAGRIFNKAGREFAHFHYVVTKRKPYFKYPKWNELPQEFHITTTGFYTVGEFTSDFFRIRSFLRKVSVLNILAKKYVLRILRKFQILVLSEN